MKKMVIVMIGVSLFICLFSFLGIIHSPIHYSKRDLMLVNAEFMIDEDVDIKLMKLESIWVSKTAYYPLKALLKQAKLEHVVLSVEKGYERNDIQSVFQKLNDQQFFQESMLPTLYNEHITGLAIDFSPMSEDSIRWLQENAHKYGFILRYPNGKEEYTRVLANQQHYRYVGVMDATLMHEKNVCLEEYLKG